MFEKDNRFYADWRDRKGVRRRKAFTTADAAQLHEETEKNKARPKKRGAEPQSLPSSAPTSQPGTRRKAIPTRATRPKTSSKSAAAKRQAKSKPSM